MFARVIIGTAVGAVVATSAVAQTASKPDGAWRGSTSLSATVAGGNTKSTNIGFNADAVRETNIDKLSFYAQHLYGKNSGVTNAQQTRLGARYDRDLNDRLYAFGGLDLEKNKPADIKLRILPQVGLGYHVIKSEPTTFNIFGGLAYNDTNRYVAADTSGLEGMVGEESIHKISATTTFRQRLAVFQGFKSELGHRTTFDAGLSTAVIGGWNLVATFSARSESKPAPGKKKTDTLLFTGLQYGWGPK